MEELEEYARTLEASGDYRVLRRLTQRKSIEIPDEVVTRRGLFVDVETTGLDPSKHEIIELAMVPFSYGLDGKIYSLGEPFQKMRQPLRAIPAEITAITGIDDSMVAGAKIDPQEVAAFAAGSVLIIAHNAEFDRRFLERFSDVFASVAWACSMTQIDWIGEGYQGFKLSYLANDAGFFYERHRATSDCLAAIELLARPLARSGRLALTELLERARRPTWRVWAESAPFDTKDLLKARSYRWNADANGRPRAWYIDVLEAELETELEFLKNEVFRRDVNIPKSRIDAYNRFSERV
ncbi:3'-5' exonuclease [Pseudotabrizicola algicola]|uniref:3'-5' exonuclease n=1 Tax=Pseudotabrizicola algicola TaxID=2709381 RepID=A0A6B3RZS4_9RHOB|nr:3'-5' exonuclease [Pseudotabrizicola algicola]NEX48642.1 3'-5' exonuclease [Pseudotabrizicola algicola]